MEIILSVKNVYIYNFFSKLLTYMTIANFLSLQFKPVVKPLASWGTNEDVHMQFTFAVIIRCLHNFLKLLILF